MKKLLALTLSLLLVFAAIPMTIASAVEIETRLDSSQVGITWAQKVWSSSLSNGVAGDYETDGYTKKLTTTRSGQGMIMVQFPASVFNEANLLKIKIAMTAETTIETKSYTAFFYKQGQNASFDQRNTANNSVHYKYGAYVTLNANTQRVFTITPENHPGVFENKLNVFCICPGAQGSTSAPVYVDYVSYTVDQLGEEYTVTVDGVEAAKVYDGKTFTVPTPAEGYHYTDGTTDYFGGEEITVTGNVDLVSEINTYDVTVEGTVADTVEHGGTFTVPTPATGYQYSDGANLYDGGEEITVTAPVELTTVVKTTKVVFTMDEGKRLPEAKSYAYLAGVTVDRNAEYVDVNGDYKLALKAQMDRAAYIKLPSDWASKPYYKPTKITFTASKDSSGSIAFKTLKFASSVDSGNYVPSGETHDVITSISYVNPTTYTIDVTEDMYDCFYISGQLYASSNWSETVDSYVLYDNVTIDYEYDFDYVEPTYYDVTIDGQVVASVVEGETFVLPPVAEGMQYAGGFVVGQEFVVTEALSFTTEKIPEFAGESTTVVSTDVKASIRLNEVKGIRFYTTVDTAALAALVGDKEYEIGTLIAPKDIAGDYLTIEDDHKKVVYNMSNGLWEGNQIVGSIIDIQDHNIARDFVARAYVLVDGVYYYSDAQSVRSLAYVADAYINDATSNYAQLDADTKALVDAWASKFNG